MVSVNSGIGLSLHGARSAVFCDITKFGQLVRCNETLHHVHRTTSRRERRVTGRFAPSPVRPIGRIQRFLLIQLKPKHIFRYGVHAMQCFVTPQLVLRKVIENVAISVRYLGKNAPNSISAGAQPQIRTPLGEFTALPSPLGGFKAAYFYGNGQVVERGWRGEKGRKRSGGEGTERERGKGRERKEGTGKGRAGEAFRQINIYHYTPASHINI